MKKSMIGFSDLSPKRALQPGMEFVLLKEDCFSDLSPKRALQLLQEKKDAKLLWFQ